MPGGKLRRRSVREVFRRRLLRVGQSRRIRDELVRLREIVGRGILNRRRGSKLIRARERERRHVGPLRRRVLLHDGPAVSVGNEERLPAIRVHDRGGLRRVDRRVTRPVGIRARVQIAELVRAVPVPVLEHCRRGRVADPDGGAKVARLVVPIVADRRHQRVELRSLRGEEVDERAVRGEAQRFRAVRVAALLGRPAPLPARTRRNRDVVVSGPRVEDCRVENGDRARDDRRARLGLANRLQERLVPLQDDIVARLRTEIRRAQGRGEEHDQGKHQEGERAEFLE